MKTDTVIIGSGISALTAAALLAKRGMNVHVLEKNRFLGGALKQFKRRGVSFDVGFHYTGCLGEGEILNTLWKYCNVLDKLEILPFPREGSDRLYLQNYDTQVDAYFSYDLLKRELLLHFPREKKAIENYFTTIQKVCSTVPFYNQTLQLSEFLKSFRSSKQSVKKYIESITTDVHLQSILAAPALLYGVETDNVSIDVHAMVAHGYYLGAYSVAGGGQAIVNAFIDTCKKNGVSFFSSTKASSIVFDNSGITGVVTESGEMIECSQVIFTGHPSHLIDIIDSKAFRPAFRKRLIELKNTLSMNIVFGFLNNAPPSLDWHNHVFLPPGANPLDKKFNQSNQRLLMMTSTERRSFNLQQHNKSVILFQPAFWHDVEKYAASTGTTRPEEYQDYKQSISKTMISQVEKIFGEQFKNITVLTAGTPLTFRDELSAPQGCAYGASHSLDQYTPDIRTRIPGLLLSGQSTLMTGIVGASLAGLISAGNIVGLEPLWEDLRVCS